MTNEAEPTGTASAVATPNPTIDKEGGIIAREERLTAAAIADALAELGHAGRTVDLRPVPFAGT